VTNKKTGKYNWIFILLPILGIATCNVYINTFQENAIIEKYQVGDYFVFSGFDGAEDMPFKIKEITPSEIIFFVPQYEIVDFDVDATPTKFYELEKQGLMYTEDTMPIPIDQMDALQAGASDITLNGESIRLEGVFGDTRQDKVSGFLERFNEVMDKNTKTLKGEK